MDNVVLIMAIQAIGGAADAARMKRVVDFYEKLPRGQAPPLQPRGLLQRYQQRYMAKGSGVRKSFQDMRLR